VRASSITITTTMKHAVMFHAYRVPWYNHGGKGPAARHGEFASVPANDANDAANIAIQLLGASFLTPGEAFDANEHGHGTRASEHDRETFLILPEDDENDDDNPLQEFIGPL